MTYKDLDAIDATPDQDLGLTIAYKLAVNQQQTKAESPGAYLAERVQHLLTDYASHHVGTVQRERIVEAFTQASEPEKQAAASALKVDLAVTVPVDAVSAEVIK